MNDGTRIIRRPRRRIARTAAAIVVAGLALLAAACSVQQQRQPVVRRFRRLTEHEQVSELPVSDRLLPLHALARCAELPRPPRQRTSPEDQRAAPRGQRLPPPGGPDCLPGPVPAQRRPRRGAHQRFTRTMRGDRKLPAGTGAGGDDRAADIRPVHALPRTADLARPHPRFRRAPWFQSAPCPGLRPEFIADQQRHASVLPRDARRRTCSSDSPGRARLNSGIRAAPAGDAQCAA
jgi:hypothetical protein